MPAEARLPSSVDEDAGVGGLCWCRRSPGSTAVASSLGRGEDDGLSTAAVGVAANGGSGVDVTGFGVEQCSGKVNGGLRGRELCRRRLVLQMSVA